MCGGAIYTPMDLYAVMGRSPRVRGSRKVDALQPVTTGSIPAGAGEPS